ncbi:putative serine/threonine-protein kinase drkB [Phytophthora citrophthora]|uniref:Serine/threonine-protein kinase drkB n=1 Tax=Phytophthora citrophthora TaxID=4793 RepID=A0AAD9LRY0_9STRA|nr:putative serine/threonine-protein kinase drkB [Phytophthora citrophthora]
MDSPFRVGGFGKIYHGTWLGSRVVIKLIDLVSNKTRREFLREAAIWKKLHHPHVIQLFGACMSLSEQSDKPGLFICEEAEKGSLRDYLFNERQAGRSPPVWRTLRDAALGLVYLHQRGIVHGDLKGNNILVSQSGVAKLTDFGLSSIQGCSDPCEAIGAFQWKAPELFGTNCSAATFEADVYAFGMCVVEALRGGSPWGSLPDAAVKYCLKKAKRAASKPGMGMTMSQVLPRPVSVENDDHWAFVKQLCAFDPSERLKLPDAIKILDQFALDEATQAF